ncbi:hypothetical protein EZS27_008321 [termite gut metagenome]|jgi:hypothetical protein|uniref:Uncharacterized protein n=1 Tax=termite gut metagenome TaxID=433724 RepID=A0A5J4SE66_9ZZZZ
MNNEDKMLQLVLSDNNLSSLYKYSAEDYQSISDALQSDDTVVVAVAKIIRGVAENSDKGIQKSVYQEVFNYLNQNLL